ncbi:MAG: sodium/proline symporter [Alphaproteobacteria bacterium]|nr:sodium/proline symporter [Alphaproteobacteria bacterium]
MSNAAIILTTLIVYKGLLIAIGIWASRRTGTEADYLIGGRTLGPWVAGLSYAATSSSAWVLLGFSGFVFLVGVSALWMLPGIWGGYALLWIVMGRAMRREAAERGHITLADYLSGDAGAAGKRLIGLISAALVVFCFIFYVAAQLQAAGTAMQSYFGLGVAESVLLGTGVVLIYSLLGGFWAISVTDMLQGMAMAFIAVVAPVAAVIAAGGPEAVLAALAADHPGHLDTFGGRSGMLAAGFVLGLSSIGLGTAGQPQLAARVMGVKDDLARRRAFVISISWAVMVFVGMAVLGLAGRTLALGLGAGQHEQVLFASVSALFPPVMAGVVLAALLSAVMSTVDSVLLSSAAAISHDARVARVFPGREVLIARVVMAALCAAAVALTLAAPSDIFSRVLFAWNALGAAFGPILLARVLQWRPGAAAVIAAMLAGFALTVFFNQTGQGPGGLYERLVPWIPPLVMLFAARRRTV